jgi:hypothetical protein
LLLRDFVGKPESTSRANHYRVAFHKQNRIEALLKKQLLAPRTANGTLALGVFGHL